MISSAHAHVVEAPAGATILRHGESGDPAYFILSGRAVAGIAPERAITARSPA